MHGQTHLSTTEKPQKRTPKRGQLSAGLTGVGGGTTLALIADSLPPNSPIKHWLIVGAPAASVSASGFIIWLWKQWDERRRRQETQILIATMEITLKEQMEDPLLTEERKAELKVEYEQVQKEKLEGLRRRLIILRADD